MHKNSDSNDNEVKVIFIESPEPTILTDGDFRDQNGDQIDNLTNHHLQASSEIKLAGNIKYDYVYSDIGEVQFYTHSKDVSKNPKYRFLKEELVRKLLN